MHTNVLCEAVLPVSLSVAPPLPLPCSSPCSSSFHCSSSAEPTEEQPPEAATPQQVVIQPAQPQGDLLGGNLLDLLDISAGPPAPATSYNPPTGGGGGRCGLESVCVCVQDTQILKLGMHCAALELDSAKVVYISSLTNDPDK